MNKIVHKSPCGVEVCNQCEEPCAAFYVRNLQTRGGRGVTRVSEAIPQCSEISGVAECGKVLRRKQHIPVVQRGLDQERLGWK